MITETKKNKPNQMKKAYIHGLSSHIHCVLINYIANDKKCRCLYPLVEFKQQDKKEVELLKESTYM